MNTRSGKRSVISTDVEMREETRDPNVSISSFNVESFADPSSAFEESSDDESTDDSGDSSEFELNESEDIAKDDVVTQYIPQVFPSAWRFLPECIADCKPYKQLNELIHKFPFTQPTGYAGNTPIKSFYDAYCLLVDNNIIDLIVTKTNKFANQAIQFAQNYAVQQHKELPQNRWFDLTRGELKVFFGLRLLMSGTVKNDFEMYWDADPFNPMSFGEKIDPIMKLYRFSDINRFLRFCDSAQPQEDNDKIFMIKPLLDKLNENFANSFLPYQHLCIEKSSKTWREKSQTESNGNAKYKVKLFKLCTGSGYTLKVLPFVLSNDTKPINADYVCLELLRDYLGKGHVLCTDKWLTSIPLAVHLATNKTYLVGSMKKKRQGILTELKKEIAPGQMISFFADEEKVLIFRFRDYKGSSKNDNTSLVLSTLHTNRRNFIKDKHGKVKRHIVSSGKGQNKTFEDKGPMTSPEAYNWYNKHKELVDKSESLAVMALELQKGNKWHIRVGDELLFCTALFNAYELYRNAFSNFDSKKNTFSNELTNLYTRLLKEGKQEMEQIISKKEPQ